MFDSLDPREEPPEQSLRLYVWLYAVWAAVGLLGFVVSIWKHGNTRILGVACYLATFILALFFLVKALATGLPTRRKLNAQSTVVTLLGLLPMFIRDLFLR